MSRTEKVLAKLFVYRRMRKKLDSLIRKGAALGLTIVAAGFVYANSVSAVLRRAGEISQAARISAFQESTRFAQAAESVGSMSENRDVAPEHLQLRRFASGRLLSESDERKKLPSPPSHPSRSNRFHIIVR